MTKEIPLTQGKVALVDDADYEWLMQWKWSCCNGSPARIPSRTSNEPRKLVYMYREIMQAPDDMEVDHKNLNRLDCRRENLRLATRTQNMRNRKAYANNRTGFKGVSPTNSQRSPFKAEIKLFGKKIYLGSFASAEDAAKAYDIAAIKLFGEFARLNF